MTEPRSAIHLVGRKAQRPSQAIEPHSAIAPDELSDRLTHQETEQRSGSSRGGRRGLSAAIGECNLFACLNPTFVPAIDSSKLERYTSEQQFSFASHQGFILTTFGRVYTRKTFMTSSPKWLMTLAAMPLEWGLGKGREVSLLRLNHESASISNFSVVLRALYESKIPQSRSRLAIRLLMRR